MAVKTFIAKRDCYWNGMHLKRGQTIQISGEVDFALLEEVVQRPVGEAPVHLTGTGAEAPDQEDVADKGVKAPRKGTNKK